MSVKVYEHRFEQYMIKYDKEENTASRNMLKLGQYLQLQPFCSVFRFPKIRAHKGIVHVMDDH